MKQQLLNNILLSCCLFFALYLYGKFGAVEIYLIHYVSVVFFAILHVLQIVFLSRHRSSPQFFILAFNLTTMLKMGISLIFLIIYYLFFSNNTLNQDKIFFSIFFLISYASFLILNTRPNSKT